MSTLSSANVTDGNLVLKERTHRIKVAYSRNSWLMLMVMNRCRKRDAKEELPLREIFDDVCRTVDAGDSDVAFSTTFQCSRSRVRYTNGGVQLCQVCLPIYATPKQQSQADDLCRLEMHRSTALQ